MAGRRELKPTNDHSSDGLLASVKSNTSQIDNALAASTESQKFDHRIDALEEIINNRLDKTNIQIKQLEDKIKQLEEQTTQQKAQIKILKDKLMNVQCHDSNRSVVESVKSTDVKGNMGSPSDIIIQREELNHSVLLPITNLPDKTPPQIKPENITNCKTDLNIQKQHHSTIVPLESEAIHVENPPLLDLKDNDGVSNTQITTNSNTTNEEKINQNKNESETINRRSVGCGNFVFARWMNSQEGELSLWSNEDYRRSLLSYIGKIYGQKYNIYQLLGPLRIEFNDSDELDQLYDVIKKFERQPGAKKSLREWQLQARSNNRLGELKSIFEFNGIDPLLLDDWKITPSNLKEIINRESINAYFDFICRDGFVTAEVGEYLRLNKEHIFGGKDYDIHNERVTLVNVDLNQSTINLADSRVDLITCFATLHHVPHLKPILSEFFRILRPGGYLILREHDCKKTRTPLAKYLNFIHAFMMIARVGEFAHTCANHITETPGESEDDSESDTTDWEQQKSDIIRYTSSIQYRTRDEWQKELECVGFRLKATLQYGSNNPQALYYAVYQLHTK